MRGCTSSFHRLIFLGMRKGLIRGLLLQGYFTSSWACLSAQPLIEVQPLPPSCFGAEDGGWVLRVRKGELPITFTWAHLDSGAGGSGAITGDTYHLGQLRAGEYRFYFEAADGRADSVTAVLQEPALLVGRLFLFEPPDACAYPGWVRGFFLASGGTEPYTYHWSDGSTSARVDTMRSGLWSVTVEDARGCRVKVDTALSLPVPLSVDVKVLGESCSGRRDGRIRVYDANGGIPPYLFSLNDGPTTDQKAWEALESGLHTLRVEDAAGCSLQIVTIVPAGLPFDLDVGPDTVLFTGDTLRRLVKSSLPLADWRWEPSVGVLSLEPSTAVLAPPFSTAYRLTAVSEEGCVATAVLRLSVKHRLNLYAPNAFWPLSGAPDNRAFTLYGEEGIEEVVVLQIFDRQGQLCFENRHFLPNSPSAGWDGTIRGQAASPGVYTWRAVVRYRNGVEELHCGDVTLVR